MNTAPASVRIDDDIAPAGLPRAFFALAFAFSWCLWLPLVAAAHGWLALPVESARTPLVMIGAAGPLVAVCVLVGRRGGARAIGRFALRALRWRMPLDVLVAAVLLCPALAAFAAYLRALAGGPPLMLMVPLALIPEIIVLLFFAGGSFQEEFGWAYAIDCMQKRWSPLSASALLGLIWGCWHLPLFFIPGLSQSYMPFWSFLVMTVALRVIAVRLYNITGQSILVTLLFHTSMNLSLNLFPLLQPRVGVPQPAWISFCFLAVVAAIPAAWGQWRRPPQ